MVFVLPWINWQNHGFYSFHPTLFHDLARANRYHTTMMLACDRNGENMFEPGIQEYKKPEPTDVNYFVVAVLRKKYDREFVMPQQSKYMTIIEPQSLKQGFIWPKEINLDPFPHFVTKLEDDLYEQLLAEWPSDYGKFEGWGENSPDSSNTLRQYSARQGLFGSHLSPLWKAFMEYTTSTHFFQEVVKTFSPHIQATYPITQLPLQTGVRGLDNAPFLLDTQLAINTPVTERSSVRGPHIDDPRELYAGLLYMPSEDYTSGGDLDIYEWKKERKFTGRAGMRKQNECPPSKVRKTGTIRHEPNTLLFFLNSPDSIHGVSPRDTTDQTRRYVNMICELNEPLFEAK